MSHELRIERHGRVAQVVLNRPDRRNALSPAVIGALERAFGELADDDGVAVVVLSGAGGFFCSGLDLKEIDPANPPRKEWIRVHRQLSRLDVPVVGAVTGGAINAGAALALACDLLIVGESAYVQVKEASMGMGAPLNTAWLARRYPASFGLQLALTCRPFGAADLHRLGAALDVVADDAVLGAATELAETMADYPGHGAALAKRDLERAYAGVGTSDSILDAALSGGHG